MFKLRKVKGQPASVTGYEWRAEWAPLSKTVQTGVTNQILKITCEFNDGQRNTEHVSVSVNFKTSGSAASSDSHPNKQEIQNQIYKNLISEARTGYMSDMLMKEVDRPIMRPLPGHTGICSCEYSSCPSFSSRCGSASSASSCRTRGQRVVVMVTIEHSPSPSAHS